MSAALNHRAPAHAGEIRRELFDYAAEHMALAAISADLAVTYAQTGDLAGLDYSVRKAVAYLRAVVPTVRDLRVGREDRQ